MIKRRLETSHPKAAKMRRAQATSSEVKQASSSISKNQSLISTTITSLTKISRRMLTRLNKIKL